jgi:hypothetical protein
MKPLAEQLHSYMVYRTKKDPCRCKLTAEWYEEYLATGMRNFFGVETDGRRIVRDARKPELLDQWQTLWWFDNLSKRITKRELESCEAQMLLWADGLGTDDPEAIETREKLRAAVKAHNVDFPAQGAFGGSPAKAVTGRQP